MLPLLLCPQGQAEIFAFTQRYASDYSGAGRTSNLTLDATKAYTPWEVPHWAYQGASRRYWDFDYSELTLLRRTYTAQVDIGGVWCT